MDITPLLGASLAIKIHVGAVVMAIILIVAIWRIRKGGQAHKLIWRIWLGAMILTAISLVKKERAR